MILSLFSQNLKSEAPLQIAKTQPPADWPSKGDIRFKRYQMRYRDGLPLVLKGVRLHIRPQEKIGIVGRTGSGRQLLLY